MRLESNAVYDDGEAERLHRVADHRQYDFADQPVDAFYGAQKELIRGRVAEQEVKHLPNEEEADDVAVLGECRRRKLDRFISQCDDAVEHELDEPKNEHERRQAGGEKFLGRHRGPARTRAFRARRRGGAAKKYFGKARARRASGA